MRWVARRRLDHLGRRRTTLIIPAPSNPEPTIRVRNHLKRTKWASDAIVAPVNLVISGRRRVSKQRRRRRRRDSIGRAGACNCRQVNLCHASGTCASDATTACGRTTTHFCDAAHTGSAPHAHAHNAAANNKELRSSSQQRRRRDNQSRFSCAQSKATKQDVGSNNDVVRRKSCR